MVETNNPQIYVDIDEHQLRDLRAGKKLDQPHFLLHLSLWPQGIHKRHGLPLDFRFNEGMVIGNLTEIQPVNESKTRISYQMSDEEMERAYALDRKTLESIPEGELWTIRNMLVSYPNEYVLTYLKSATRLRTLVGDNPRGIVLPGNVDLKRDVPSDLSNWDIAIIHGIISPERVIYPAK